MVGPPRAAIWRMVVMVTAMAMIMVMAMVMVIGDP